MEMLFEQLVSNGIKYIFKNNELASKTSVQCGFSE